MLNKFSCSSNVLLSIDHVICCSKNNSLPLGTINRLQDKTPKFHQLSVQTSAITVYLKITGDSAQIFIISADGAFTTSA